MLANDHFRFAIHGKDGHRETEVKEKKNDLQIN